MIDEDIMMVMSTYVHEDEDVDEDIRSLMTLGARKAQQIPRGVSTPSNDTNFVNHSEAKVLGH